MRAGTLTYTALIERDRAQSETFDSFGAITGHTVTQTKMRVQLVNDALDETLHASGAVNSRVLTFKLRFLDDLRPGDTLLFDGTRYEILTIKQLGRRSAIEITSRELP